MPRQTESNERGVEFQLKAQMEIASRGPQPLERTHQQEPEQKGLNDAPPYTQTADNLRNRLAELYIETDPDSNTTSPQQVQTFEAAADYLGGVFKNISELSAFAKASMERNLPAGIEPTNPGHPVRFIMGVQQLANTGTTCAILGHLMTNPEASRAMNDRVDDWNRNILKAVRVDKPTEDDIENWASTAVAKRVNVENAERVKSGDLPMDQYEVNRLMTEEIQVAEKRAKKVHLDKLSDANKKLDALYDLMAKALVGEKMGWIYPVQEAFAKLVRYKFAAKSVRAVRAADALAGMDASIDHACRAVGLRYGYAIAEIQPAIEATKKRITDKVRDLKPDTRDTILEAMQEFLSTRAAELNAQAQIAEVQKTLTMQAGMASAVKKPAGNTVAQETMSSLVDSVREKINAEALVHGGSIALSSLMDSIHRELATLEGLAKRKLAEQRFLANWMRVLPETHTALTAVGAAATVEAEVMGTSELYNQLQQAYLTQAKEAEQTYKNSK